MTEQYLLLLYFTFTIVPLGIYPDYDDASDHLDRALNSLIGNNERDQAIKIMGTNARFLDGGAIVAFENGLPVKIKHVSRASGGPVDIKAGMVDYD